MFGKLLKYEFKDSLRTFVPLWLALIAVAGMNGFSFRFIESDSNLVNIFRIGLVMAAFGLFVASFVTALIMVIMNFGKGLLGDGGYLAFSLPVRTWQLIASKLLPAMVMLIGCILAAGISGFLMLSILSSEFLPSLGEFCSAVWKGIQAYPNSILVGFEYLVLLLLGLSLTIQRFYSAMAVGHLSNDHRIVWSVVSYVLIGWAFDALMSLVGVPTFHYVTSIDLIPSVQSVESFLGAAGSVGIISLVYVLVGNVLLWIVTNYILDKRLNLL